MTERTIGIKSVPKELGSLYSTTIRIEG